MNRLTSLLRRTLRPLKRSRLVRALNLTLPTRVAGRRYAVPLLHGVGTVNLGGQEPWMADVLAALLPAFPGAFVDVGANVGQTLLKARAVAPDVPYVGFEPNPASAYYVGKLIEANGLAGCTLVPAGLGAQTALATLHVYDDHDASVGASIAAAFRPDDVVRRTQVVPVFTLPDALDALEVERVGVLKLDAEGVEVDILETAQGLLQAQRPAVLVEILPAYAETNTYRVERQERLLGLLRASGYALYQVVRDEAQALRGVERVEALGVHADHLRTDFVALPEGVDAARLFERRVPRP